MALNWRRIVDVSTGWPVINAGAMRHAVTIQQYGPASPAEFDAAGVVSTWTPFATAMAAIDSVSGTDRNQDGQLTSKVFILIGIWYQPGIQSNMQVVSDNGSLYVIQSIENVMELNVVLVLTCVGLGANT